MPENKEVVMFSNPSDMTDLKNDVRNHGIKKGELLLARKRMLTVSTKGKAVQSLQENHEDSLLGDNKYLRVPLLSDAISHGYSWSILLAARIAPIRDRPLVDYTDLYVRWHIYWVVPV